MNTCGNKKKALIITALAGFIRGFLINDIKILQQMGYEVHCAANATTVKMFNVNEFFSSMDVIFHQIDFSSTSPISKKSYIAYRQVKDLEKKIHFDVIHCHTPIVGALVRVASRKLRKNGTKVIYTTHGLAFHKDSSIKTKLIYGSIERFSSWFTDVIITINYQDYKQMKKAHCKEVFHINGVGVDTNRFMEINIDRSEYRKNIGVSDDEIMILSVGELSARKNHQIIIKALVKLDVNKYVFVICGKAMNGEGTYDALKALAIKNNVRVIFLGFRTDIPEICHCADISVIPSTREGLGLAGIESLASGVPVIGTNVQGIKDYVLEGETGFLCNAYDEDAFAESIKKLSNIEIRESMMANCINKALEFDIKVSHSQMQSIYKSVLENQVQ